MLPAQTWANIFLIQKQQKWLHFLFDILTITIFIHLSLREVSDFYLNILTKEKDYKSQPPFYLGIAILLRLANEQYL